MINKYIIRLNVVFRVTGRSIIPPFSAKVSKLILYRISELYRRLTSVDKPFKPIAISPLFCNGYPLIKLKGETNPLMLNINQIYSFNCCIVTDANLQIDELISLEKSVIQDFFGVAAILDSIRMEVRRFDSLGFQKPPAIKINFLSPALLQLPRHRKWSLNRYVLFPVPSLLISSLVEHWNNNCDPHLFIKNPHYVCYYSNYALLEADFRLKPVTVIYDDKRLIRGILGWVLYDLRKSRNTPTMKRILTLLDYAQYVGIGKSRAAGFGQVSIICLNQT